MIINIILLNLILLYLIVILSSFSPSDPGWMQSDWGSSVNNIGGIIGARLADFLFFMFGCIAYILPSFILINFWIFFFKTTNINIIEFFFKLMEILIILLISCALAQYFLDDIFYFSSGGIIGNILLHFIKFDYTVLDIIFKLFYIGIIFFIFFLHQHFFKLIKVIKNQITEFIQIFFFIFIKKINNNRGDRVQQAYFNSSVFSLFFSMKKYGIHKKPINKKQLNHKIFNTYSNMFVDSVQSYKLHIKNTPIKVKYIFANQKKNSRYKNKIHCYLQKKQSVSSNKLNNDNDIKWKNSTSLKYSKKPNNKIIDSYINTYNNNRSNITVVIEKKSDQDQKNNLLLQDQLAMHINMKDFHNKEISSCINDLCKNLSQLSLSKNSCHSCVSTTDVNSSDNVKFILPNINLLLPYSEKKIINKDRFEDIARLIEKKLLEYRIVADVVKIISGPVVTCFALNLSAGIKSARIVSLSRDLARVLSVNFVRVLEIIPDTPYVGVEIPNKNRDIVSLRDIISSNTFQNMSSPLSLILGKDIAGNPIIVDLRSMPHLLVAGTTGSGKSIGINSMIISILYKSTPEEVRFIMIDPKILELSIYTHIPHLLNEVITNIQHTESILQWCVKEMERRYKLMSEFGVRNLENYNYKIEKFILQRKLINKISALHKIKKLPYIVIIIDELSDLMMENSKIIEILIIRLTQKARAAGIHLILSTQRPSVDVITGLIKANIPSRIAFTVSSQIDSRTILGQSGAESLLGMGDMLYLPSNSSIPIRIHGAYVHDKEIHAVVNFWKTQNKKVHKN